MSAHELYVGFGHGSAAEQRRDLAAFFGDIASGLMPLIRQGAAEIETSALGEMVAGARSRVKSETGRLLNGITAHRDGDVSIFEAHALAADGTDYALPVEKGRRGSTHADADFFAGDGGHALGARRGRGDGGDAPEPFFYPATVEPLAKREQGMSDLLDNLLRKVGFTDE